MKFIIIGKNIDVTPGLKQAVESKLGKLERYFTPDTEIHVTLSVQREHQKIEVTIPVKGGLIRSEQESTDMYVSIDLVEEVIERQLRKYKNKLIARHQEGGNFKQEFFENQDVVASHSALIGKFSADEIFYLMSRGIAQTDAQKLLTKGFLLNGISYYKDTLESIIDKYWR